MWMRDVLRGNKGYSYSSVLMMEGYIRKGVAVCASRAAILRTQLKCEVMLRSGVNSGEDVVYR